MNYLTIYGACESIDDASYERDEEQDNGQVVKVRIPQTQVTLTVPGMRDLVKVTFPAEVKVSSDWEDKMTMLRVECDKFTVSTGVRNKKPWAIVGFHGTSVEPASSGDANQLSQQRKQAKANAKALRAAAQAKKLGTAS